MGNPPPIHWSCLIVEQNFMELPCISYLTFDQNHRKKTLTLPLCMFVAVKWYHLVTIAKSLLHYNTVALIDSILTSLQDFYEYACGGFSNTPHLSWDSQRVLEVPDVLREKYRSQLEGNH